VTSSALNGSFGLNHHGKPQKNFKVGSPFFHIFFLQKINNQATK